MENEEALATALYPERKRQNYQRFLNTFVHEVESLSVYGERCWEELCEEVNIYLPGASRLSWKVTWMEKVKIPNHKLNLQCAYLVREGLYEHGDLDGYCYFPMGDRDVLAGEEQTAEEFADCNGNKLLISSLFILALLKSGDKNRKRGIEFSVCKCGFDQIYYPDRMFDSVVFYEENPGRILSGAASKHLKENKIWYGWHHACTSLVPLVGDLQRSKKIFEDYYDLAAYLAQEFVLLSSKYSVCTYNFVSEPDPVVMSHIEGIKKRRKREQKKMQKAGGERKLKKAEEEKQQNEQLEKDYELACKKILQYTNDLPKIFRDLKPLHQKWRSLTKEQLEILIWSAPFSVLAKMFNSSDNGLRKWAKEMGVDYPKGGFWAKVQAKKIAYPNGKRSIDT